MFGYVGVDFPWRNSVLPRRLIHAFTESADHGGYVVDKSSGLRGCKIDEKQNNSDIFNVILTRVFRR